MKTLILIIAALSLGGCSSLERLTGGKESAPPAPVQVWTSVPDLGDAPNFAVATPSGYTRTVFHGALPASGQVQLPADSGALMNVFLQERTLNQWFLLNDEYSEAFWYVYNPATGQVTISGGDLNLKAYCIYFYSK